MTLMIAHRGDPVGQVENTVASFQAGVRAGAGMVEIDVRLTADGVPVLLHDDTLARIWGVPRDLAAMAADQVARLRGPDGARVPTLAEIAVLAVDSNCELMVDLPDAAAGVAAYQVLAAAGALDRCLFAGRTRPVREHSASARIALTWNDYTPPDRATLEFFRPEFFNPHFQLLTASIADQMHERGIGVSVWTVDHPRDMAAVITQGADAVITNRIGDLVELVAQQA